MSTPCSHQLQDLAYLILDCPTAVPIWHAIFGSSSPLIFSLDLLGRGPTVGYPWSFVTAPSFRRGWVVSTLDALKDTGRVVTGFITSRSRTFSWEWKSESE